MSEIAHILDTPSDIDIAVEQSVLGAMLIGHGIDEVLAAGGADLFGDPVHADIVETIRAITERGEEVGVHSVASAMRDHPGLAELGGNRYIVRLPIVAQLAGLKHHIAMLIEARRKRLLGETLAAATAAIARGDETSDDIVARLEAALVSIEEKASGSRRTSISIAEATRSAIDDFLSAWEGKARNIVPTGIDPLDSIIGGFSPGQLILMGARPSMGKTAVALNIALNVARRGQGVAIVSAEMTPQALAYRALGEVSSVPYADMSHHPEALDEDRLRHVIESAMGLDLPIEIIDFQQADIGRLHPEVRKAARRLERVHKTRLDLVIVDYAQLLRAGGRGRYEQITEISMALKRLARRMEAPVLALSQLSRQLESRDNKRPMLSDLRESGQLEQDADTVLFLHREERYLERDKPGFDQPEKLADWEASLARVRGMLEIIVAKQRQGALGTAHCKVDLATNRIWWEAGP